VSNLCKTTLCTTVQNTVNNTTGVNSVEDILFSTISVDTTQPTNRISKVTVNDLPDANTVPNGHVAYLDDAKVPVIASNCSWIGFDGRTFGTFDIGNLFSWGYATCGQLGVGILDVRTSCSPAREFCSATDWCLVSTTFRHAAAIKKSGELWVWGSNSCGALGDGTTTTRCSPIREICSATNWCQVSAGSYHTAAIKTSGEIWTWGSGNSGRLGDGTTVNSCSPIREICSATDWCQASAGGSHTAAINTSGQIWAWGFNGCGRLGDGTTVNSCSPIREICSATDWCQASAGGSHTAAIKTCGQLWAWGFNGCGRLGDGTTVNSCSPVREFCSATDWCQASAGGAHTVAIKTCGQIWTWGNNQFYGRLGDGTVTQRCSPVREICSATDWCQVSAGGNHTAAIKTSGQLWAWGRNTCGALGNGFATGSCSPVREFISATDWRQVSVGDRHTAAVTFITCVCR
jgi:alpha-tubulin suppressor-like RCC1 family protein